jgi:undecaprenyl-diphosphatase
MFSVPVQLDQQLFLFLNSANSPFWDKVMYAISMTYVWIPLYLAILIYLALKYRRKFLIIIIFVIIAVSLTDQIALLIKNSVDRLRPCHEPTISGLVHLVNGRCGGLYGFVSSHAANSFNVALLSLMFIRKRWYTVSIIIWAAVVGYSRIYLGAHYPGDVICGSILGVLIGWTMYRLYDMTDRYVLQKKRYFSDRNPVSISPPPNPPVGEANPLPPKGGSKSTGFMPPLGGVGG